MKMRMLCGIPQRKSVRPLLILLLLNCAYYFSIPKVIFIFIYYMLKNIENTFFAITLFRLFIEFLFFGF